MNKNIDQVSSERTETLSYDDILKEAIACLLNGEKGEQQVAFALRYCSISELRRSPPVSQIIFWLSWGVVYSYDIALEVYDRSFFDFLTPHALPWNHAKSAIALALNHISGKHCHIRKCKLLPCFPLGIENTNREEQTEMEMGDTFQRISDEIKASRIEDEFKKTALYDLTQSEISYSAGAYKSCVVMLGAVLEALMLGALRQAEILDIIRNDDNLPSIPKLRGIAHNLSFSRNDELAKLIASLNFEQCRQLCEHIFNTKDLGVEGIQHFRNAIHPWVVIERPDLYRKYDRTRAIIHIGALAKLSDHILSWKRK